MKEKIKKFGVVMLFCGVIAIIFFGYSFVVNHTWNIESGVFVRAEYHPEHVINVTWILLEDKSLRYGTHNPEVLDLIPGKTYEFGEGLISGNFGKRLVWIEEI